MVLTAWAAPGEFPHESAELSSRGLFQGSMSFSCPHPHPWPKGCSYVGQRHSGVAYSSWPGTARPCLASEASSPGKLLRMGVLRLRMKATSLSSKAWPGSPQPQPQPQPTRCPHCPWRSCAPVPFPCLGLCTDPSHWWSTLSFPVDLYTPSFTLSCSLFSALDVPPSQISLAPSTSLWN